VEIEKQVKEAYSKTCGQGAGLLGIANVCTTTVSKTSSCAHSKRLNSPLINCGNVRFMLIRLKPQYIPSLSQDIRPPAFPGHSMTVDCLARACSMLSAWALLSGDRDCTTGRWLQRFIAGCLFHRCAIATGLVHTMIRLAESAAGFWAQRSSYCWAGHCLLLLLGNVLYYFQSLFVFFNVLCRFKVTQRLQEIVLMCMMSF